MTNEERLLIASICKQARIDNKLTVRDVAQETGISFSEVSLIENGKRRLSLEMAAYYLQLGADLSCIGIK